MMARCVEWAKRKRECLAVALGAGVLFILYTRNIPNICTIWEIGDEAGYLFNAALWTGQPWTEAFSNFNAYYGFGYSVLLIPIFLFCDTGRELIQGAVSVNVLLVVGTYLLQVKLMSELFCRVKKEIWAFAAFAVSFYPYLICNAYKVLCEIFLQFQLWLIALLLYYLIKYKRKLYYLMLALAVPYIFFIHSRAIVIIVALLLSVAVYVVKRRQITKKSIVASVIAIVVFVLLYYVKGNILNVLGTGKIAPVAATGSTMNLFSVSYFTDRLKWLFGGLGYYFIQAVGKGFYVITTTMGVAVWGLVCAVQHLKSGLKEYKSGDEFCHEITILFLLLSAILMFAASAVNGVGTTYAYMFYGRYYEYIVNILILFGMGMYFESKVSWRSVITTVFLTVACGIISLQLENYAASSSITIDTNRLAGFSYAISQSENQYRTMILLLVVLSILFLCICGVVKDLKYKNVIICFLLFVSFIPTNKKNIAKINEVNANCESDTVMAEYIVDNIDEQEIYFVYEPYRYSSFYLRMQVFIKEYPLHVIYPEELDEVPEDSYVITYIESDMAGELHKAEESEVIMSSYTYELFVK